MAPASEQVHIDWLDKLQKQCERQIEVREKEDTLYEYFDKVSKVCPGRQHFLDDLVQIRVRCLSNRWFHCLGSK